MDRKTLFAALLYAATSAVPAQTQNMPSNLSEHCFEISENRNIAMQEVATTPGQFLKDSKNSGVESAINGTYFGGKDPRHFRPEGIAYLADGNQFADGNLRYVRGFFTVSKDGKQINISETLDGRLSNYWLVIGTHPLLVADSKINSQSQETRYASTGLRSAIGTKNGRNICFAVSENELTMAQWAERLQNSRYKGAINLDGGPISQMAVRENGNIKIKGQGKSPTRLVIFEYKK